MEPSAFFVSCIDCTRLQAEEGCPESFHLCTRLELWTGKCLALKRRVITITKYALCFIFYGNYITVLPCFTFSVGGYQVVQKLGLKSPGVTIFTGDTSAEAIQLEGMRGAYSASP